MNFKDQLIKDLDVFINKNEFGDLHQIDGVEMPVVVDDDILEEFSGRSAEMENAMEGIYQKATTIFVKVSDYEKPEIGYRLKLDDSYYYVTGVSESAGLLKINLISNES